MGVIKLHEAPKHIATNNGRGSICNTEANVIPIGVNITATTALDINADDTAIRHLMRLKIPAYVYIELSLT